MKPIVVIAALALTSACGQSTEEPQTQELEQSAEAVREGAEQMAKGMADLAASFGKAAGSVDGKPVEAVNFRDLQALLPTLPDWTREAPTGERMTAPVSFSEASVTHTKDEATIETKITDSALHQMLIAPFTMFLAGNYERETSDGYEKSVKIADAPGFERWDSTDKSGDLTVIVNGRFIVQIEGRGIDDAKVLHETLGRMDLQKLGGLQ
jgi:hypothetical protein